MDDSSNNSKAKLVGSTKLRSFSLRLFLFAITLFCVWLAFHTQRCQRQRAAVTAIKNYGGWIRYDFQYRNKKFGSENSSWVPKPVLDLLGVDFFHSVVDVNLVCSEDSGKREDNPATDLAPLALVADLSKVKTLMLQSTQVDNDSLKHVARINRLKTLYMFNVENISDEGVTHLAGSKNLESILLTNASITDDSLETFATMPNLKELTLQFNRFSDNGIKHLLPLKNKLETLAVCGPEIRRESNWTLKDIQNLPKDYWDPLPPNDITDATLEFLLDFERLSLLEIQNSRITNQGLLDFQQKRPSCDVIVSDVLVN